MDLRLTNEQLRADRLPPTEDHDAVLRFAHTFDGYSELGGFEAASQPANDALARYESQGEVPHSLTQLRNCLFFEHRRWRHFGEDPDPRAREYIDALMEAIRSKVVARDLSIRDACPHDFPAVVALNRRWEHVTSPLAQADLVRLASASALCRVADLRGKIAGFLLALGPGVDYSSVNYRWFDERYDRFLYIDRVMVGEGFQRAGLGEALYADAISFARERAVPHVVCEVDREPANVASVAFHDKLGFREVGTQRVAEGTKLVSLRELTVE